MAFPFTGKSQSLHREHDNNVRVTSFGVKNVLIPSSSSSSSDDARENGNVGGVTYNVRKITQGNPYQRYPNGYEQQSFKPVINPSVTGGQHVINRSVPRTAIQYHSQTYADYETATRETLIMPQTIDKIQKFPPFQNGGKKIRTRVVMKRRRPERTKSPSDEQNLKNTRAASAYHTVPTGSTNLLHGGAVIPAEAVPAIHKRIQEGNSMQRQSDGNPMTITTEKLSTLNLKTFLKQQTETLSLSELLQTQNLSLADLLRGNTDASVIFNGRQTAPVTQSVSSPNYYLPSNIKETYEPFEQDREILKTTASSVSKTNEKRMQPFGKGIFQRKQFKNKIQTLQPKAPADSTEGKTTTVRNWQPFRPAGLTPQERKNELQAKLKNYQRRNQVTTTTTTTTTGEPEVSSNTIFKENFDISSSAAAAAAATTTTSTSTMPPVAIYNNPQIPIQKKRIIPFKSSNNPALPLIIPERKPEVALEKFAAKINYYQPNDVWTTENSKIDTLKITTGRDEHPFENTREKSYEMTFGTSTTQRYDYVDSSTEIIFRENEPVDELIELIRSEQNAKALQKILDSRNMTLREILDNREKSTVQSNIEELFSNREKKRIFSTQTTIIFGSLPHFYAPHPNRFKSLKGAEYEELYADESAPNVGKIDVAGREPRFYNSPSSVSSSNEKSILNFKPDDLTADTSNTENLALWKLSEKSFVYGNPLAPENPPTVNVNNNNKNETKKDKNYKITTPAEDDNDDDDIILLETLHKNKKNINRHFDFDSGDLNKERKPKIKEEGKDDEDVEKSNNIPPAVKSAIIASGVVMGIALFVFVAIFAACGWRQRKIHLKSSPSILSDSLSRNKNKRTKSGEIPSSVNFKKKTSDFDNDDCDDDDGGSESGTSFAGSYLWSTFKNTFTSRASTLKTRLAKDEKETLGKKSKNNLGNRYSKGFYVKNNDDNDDILRQKIDKGRNVINTSLSFNRTRNKDDIDYF